MRTFTPDFAEAIIAGGSMYVIRLQSGPQRLEVELSGTADEVELLRMISQGAALASADGCQYVHCDIARLAAAQHDPHILATALAAADAPVRRIAITTAAPHAAAIRQVLRLSGMTRTARCFETRSAALSWLKRCAEAASRPSTAARHASVLDHGKRPAAGGRVHEATAATSAA